MKICLIAVFGKCRSQVVNLNLVQENIWNAFYLTSGYYYYIKNYTPGPGLILTALTSKASK